MVGIGDKKLKTSILETVINCWSKKYNKIKKLQVF